MRSETRKTEAMMALALFFLFALCALASVLVLTDSGMRAVDAWHRLRGELRMISGECAAQLVQPESTIAARVVRFDGNAFMLQSARVAA